MQQIHTIYHIYIGEKLLSSQLYRYFVGWFGSRLQRAVKISAYIHIFVGNMWVKWLDRTLRRLYSSYKYNERACVDVQCENLNSEMNDYSRT